MNIKSLSSLNIQERSELISLMLIDISTSTSEVTPDEFEEFFSMVTSSVNGTEDVSANLLTFLLGVQTLQQYIETTMPTVMENLYLDEEAMDG